ncbi:polysaccharide biosynthesis protein [Desulfobotulus sp. H1]|uniref:Polysaccharide biosynthesis protein n=1 Tax=Desulfobotulus pelophilus TaxID=2823377 RepID=A0ABT3NCX6_9BACT|nr:nucleoside-diphosphate sugar epimerase/dehydratase [Desulfobotulus pelophilus]MCW7755319.1 polysaccharide biosynthesis protein [Desulfobotulus pelophilus]
MISKRRIIDYLIGRPRWQKRVLSLLADIFFIMLALWLAFVLRLGYANVQIKDILWILAVGPVLSIPVFIRLGLYRAIIRYIGTDALKTIFHAVTISTLSLALIFFWLKDFPTLVPRSVVVNYWLFAMVFIGGSRFLIRNFVNQNMQLKGLFLPLRHPAKPHAAPVAVYGAGAAGFELMGALSRSREFLPVAFLDDNPELRGRVMAGMPVVEPAMLPRLIEQHQIQYVLLAMPSVPRSRKQQIIAQLENLNVHVKTLPSVNEMAEGKVAIQDIQDVDIADLLGRDPVLPHKDLLARCLFQKNVMVTGAGGSIGAEICRQVLRQKPVMLILFEQSEFALYHIERELQAIRSREALQTKIIPVLGSVCAWGRVLAAFRSFSVHTVYHAAAYKHVPLVEQNMAEGIRNNVFGTLVTAQAALVAGVSHFILVSTDKAVRPTNVMGASKRMAEMALQALSHLETLQKPLLVPEKEAAGFTNNTCFSMVRFGNVLGSSGSVIPLFRKQIESGGPVTVTHPSITRFFMTIPEASELVLQAGAMARGGDVFLLDMGEPVSILNLARRMILLSGRTVRDEEKPSGDIEIVFTGLRSGEKLYEELLLDTQGKESTSHPKIFRAFEDGHNWQVFSGWIERIHEAMHYCFPHGAPETCNCESLRQTLKECVGGYEPQCDIVDFIWNQSCSAAMQPDIHEGVVDCVSGSGGVPRDQ